MSSLKNSIHRSSYRELSQPEARKKFGLLEKHKYYVIRAKAYHKKELTIKKLKEKAANRNPDEFYFKMNKTKTVDGVHRPESVANKYTEEELKLMKTEDMGYVLQKLQSEKKKIEKLTAVLHGLGNQQSKGHLYYAEDREEAKEMQSKISKHRPARASDGLNERIKRNSRRTVSSHRYRELEARKNRVNKLEKLYMDMSMQKKRRKRKPREDEIVHPTSKTVYKWKSERKR